jgi:antitoxin ParD1/3/4
MKLMSFHIVNLTQDLEQFVSARVENGFDANASEVMRSALHALEQQQRENGEKLAELRGAIEEGLASGAAEDREVAMRLEAYVAELAKGTDGQADS